MSGWGVARVVFCMGVSAWLAGVAGAGQTTPGSGLLFIADNEGSVEGNPFFDTNYPYPHFQTRAGDAVLGVGYGVVNWGGGFCTAGRQARLANWDNADDDYEKLGAWGRGGGWTEITRAGRGLVRYDQDTYVLLCTQYLAENANGSRPPTLLQVEYYDEWFTAPPYTQDQYLDSLNFDSMYLVRAAPRPGVGVQWGPRPQDTFLTPPGPCDWTWTGSGTVGKLQFADTYTLGPSYAWNNDPNANPTYDYITFANPLNYKTVDDSHQPGNVGALYVDSRAVSNNANDYFSESSALELAAFYGESENVLYMTQYAGRIYKMTGVKNLGWRRRAGQAAAGTRLGDGVYITQSPDWFFPVYVGGSTYAADASGGGPVIGDASQVDPNDPNSAYEGTAITSVELFNADPNSPLDPIVSDRHYTGLAVDCGGRVYAVGERVAAPFRPWKYQGTQADVWNGAPGAYGPNRIETQNTVGSGTPDDPVRGALFGDPWTTDVEVGDTLVLTGGSVDPSFLNVTFTILAIDPNGYMAKLDGDCGDSLAWFDVSYRVYGPLPCPDPYNPWPSEAMVDVYNPDGSLSTTIELNVLARPDGMPLGSYLYDGGNIEGVVAHGDVEIDPGLIYDPNHPTYPLPPLPEDVTRLWIMGAGGDGDPDTDDGLDLLVVDVFLDIWGWGTVEQVELVGGIDDVDLPIGQFYDGDYHEGFDPWNLWISFGDLEFDGEGNMVYMGGGGIDGNEYAGVSTEALRRAVYEMTREADPNDPNFGDGIVRVDAFDLDMNIYGFKTAFGMAFDNSPLINHGAPQFTHDYPPWPEPPQDGSLPKTQNNLLWVYFDYPIVLPPVGYPLSIVDMHDGTDVSGAFTYVIDPDDPSGHTLKATENGAQLVNQHWYTVSRSPDWDTVEPFTYDLYTLRGDCAPSGRVTTADYTCVKAAMGVRGSVRADLNGSGRVTTADYSVVKEHLGDRGPDKPAGVGRIGQNEPVGCLPPPVGAGAGDEYPYCGEEVVEVTVGPGTVHVVHRNAVYNCCPDEILVIYTGHGAVLQLFEQEILTMPCACLCCYDVETTIVDLPPGDYVLQVFWDDGCYTEPIVVP